MFQRQRPHGLWTFDSVVTGAEFEYIDAHLAVAIDGDQGGAYTLHNDLSIGGSAGAEVTYDLPVTVTGLLTASGDVIIGSPSSATTFGVEAVTTFTGAVTFNGGSVDFYAIPYFRDEAQFHGDAFFYDNATFDADVYVVSGATLSVLGTANLHGATQIGDTSANALTVLATSTFASPAFFNGDVTLGDTAGDTVSLKAIMRNSGLGRYVQRQVQGGDADASYSPTTATHVYVPSGTLTADHDYSINDAGAVDGDRIHFSTRDSNHAINIKWAGSTAFVIKAAAGLFYAVTMERIGGVWRYVASSPF